MSNNGLGRGRGVRRRDFMGGVVLAPVGALIGGCSPSVASVVDPPGGHPYLFFGAGDVEAIRRRCATSMKPQLDVLLAYARAHLGETPPSELRGGYEPKGDMIEYPFLSHIVNFSFLAVVTGEAQYRDAARRWALALAGMKEWVGSIGPGPRCDDCGYPEGWAVTALAAAYDWLYPHLDADERALLVDKIRILTSVLHDATFAGEWWTGAYLHHDTWIPVGGMGLGAMAIVEEVPEALTWAKRADHEIRAALDWLGSDGAWPEGPCGMVFALISVLPFIDAYRRVLPDLAAGLVGNEWLRRCWKFREYPRTPDGQFLAFGDCRENGSYQNNAYEGAPVLRFLARLYDNPHAQWLAAREWEKRPNPFTAVWEIVWMDPRVDEAPPDDLPAGVLFDNQGMAFVRTGWDDGATLLAFRCDSLLGRRAASLYRGENLEVFNNSTTHVHADANSFGVWSRGDFAVTMARYGRRETEFQNSLLVDGKGQYSRFGPDHVGRPDGRVTAFFSSRGASLVEGDAARAYPPGLQRYVRRLYLVDPGIVFLFDEVVAERPVGLEWRIHVDNGASMDVGGGGFSSVSSGRKTVVRLADPGGVRLGETADDWNRAVTMSARGKTTRAELAAVLLPSLPADASPAVTSPSERSFVVDALDSNVLAVFSAAPGTLEIPGRLSAEGTAAIAVTRGASTGFFAAGSTLLTLDGETLLSADTAVTASYWRRGASAVLTVSTPSVVVIDVAVGFPANRVERADGASVDVTSRGRRVRIRVPAGVTTYVLAA